MFLSAASNAPRKGAGSVEGEAASGRGCKTGLAPQGRSLHRDKSAFPHQKNNFHFCPHQWSPSLMTQEVVIPWREFLPECTEEPISLSICLPQPETSHPLSGLPARRQIRTWLFHGPRRGLAACRQCPEEQLRTFLAGFNRAPSGLSIPRRPRPSLLCRTGAFQLRACVCCACSHRGVPGASQTHCQVPGWGPVLGSLDAGCGAVTAERSPLLKSPAFTSWKVLK